MNHAGHDGGGRRSWLMMACCIPMLVIAVVLGATGVVSWVFLLFALGCTTMMAMMMGGMGGMHGSADSAPPRTRRGEPEDGPAERTTHDTHPH